jgi:hypothetical protein
LLFALALLGGCGPSEPGNDPTGNYPEGSPPPAPGGNRWRYSLNIPAGFVREDVQGIDSAVARYHAPNVVLSMDHGMYGGAPTCSSDNCELIEEELDGKDAVIGRYRFRPSEEQGRGPFFVDVYVELGRHALEEGLNMRAHCETQAACDRALAIFRNVRFHRL